MCSCFHFRLARVPNLTSLLRTSSRSMTLFSKNISVPIPSTIKYWVKVFGVKQVKSLIRPPKLPLREVADLIWPPKLPFQEVADLIWPPKLPFQEVADPIWPPKLPFREVADLIWPPKLAFQEVADLIWPPKLAFREVDTLIRPPRLYPRPGQESKTGVMFHFTAFSDQILSPKFESLAGWESKWSPFFILSDRARKATRKCVAVGHSEERSRPHFDTSKSKITLLGIASYPSLHSATKDYV